MSPFTLLIHILDSAIGHFCPELLSRFQMLHPRASQHRVAPFTNFLPKRRQLLVVEAPRCWEVSRGQVTRYGKEAALVPLRDMA